MGFIKKTPANPTNYMKVYFNFNHIEYTAICHALALYWSKNKNYNFAGIINDAYSIHYPYLIKQKD